jgi:hypothetical protein
MNRKITIFIFIIFIVTITIASVYYEIGPNSTSKADSFELKVKDMAAQSGVKIERYVGGNLMFERTDNSTIISAFTSQVEGKTTIVSESTFLQEIEKCLNGDYGTGAQLIRAGNKFYLISNQHSISNSSVLEFTP